MKNNNLFKMFLYVALIIFQTQLFGADMLVHDKEQDRLAKVSLELFMKNMAPFRVDTDKNISELLAYIPTLKLPPDKVSGINFVLKELFGPTHKGYWYDFRAKDVLANFWFFAAHFNKPGGYQNKQEKNPNASKMLKDDMVNSIFQCKLVGHGGLPFVGCFTIKSQTFLSKILGYMPGIVLDPAENIKEKAITSFTLFFKHDNQKNLFASDNRKDWIKAAKEWTKVNTMNIDQQDQALYQQFFLEELTKFMDNQEMPRIVKLFKEPKDALEDSFEGLIEKYKQNINNALGKQALSALNEIAYTQEGYANKYTYI
ncbi:MAG: hypothetical protein P4L22_05450, partial [Candidatus Babeliales bacterium]|nr:hypothetical protein [Candidatus Babeliales bacterium]